MIEGCIELVPGEEVKDVAKSLEDAVMSTCEADRGFWNIRRGWSGLDFSIIRPRRRSIIRW